MHTGQEKNHEKDIHIEYKNALWFSNARNEDSS